MAKKKCPNAKTINQIIYNIIDKDSIAQEFVKQMELFETWFAWRSSREIIAAKSSKDMLNTYMRVKIAYNDIDKFNYVKWLVDRINSFWDYTWVGNIYETINKLSLNNDKELLAKWLTKNDLTKVKQAFAVNAVLQFEYLSQTDAIASSLFKDLWAFNERKKWKSAISEINLVDDLNNRFDALVWDVMLKNDKLTKPEAYQRAMENIFWTAQTWNITSTMMDKLIRYGWSLSNFSDVLIYKYVTSWKANFQTAFQMMDKIYKWVKSTKQYKVWDIWYDFKDMSKQEKKAVLFSYLTNVKNAKSSWLLWDAIQISMWIDNLPIWVKFDVYSARQAYIGMQVWMDWKQLINHVINWVSDGSILEDSVIQKLRTYSPHQMYWISEDIINQILPYNYYTIGKVTGLRWAITEARDDVILKIIKEWNITKPEDLVSAIKDNQGEINKAMNDVLDGKLTNEWKVLDSIVADTIISASSKWDPISLVNKDGTNKNIAFVEDQWAYFNSTMYYKDNWEITKRLYEWNSMSTNIEINGATTYNEILNKWWVIILQDKSMYKEIIDDKWKITSRTITVEWKDYELISNVEVVIPITWLRYYLNGWLITINSTSEEYLNRVFSWLWDTLKDVMRYDNTLDKKVLSAFNEQYYQIARDIQLSDLRKLSEWVKNFANIEMDKFVNAMAFRTKMSWRVPVLIDLEKTLALVDNLISTKSDNIVKLISEYFPWEIAPLNIKIDSSDVIDLFYWDKTKAIYNIWKKLWFVWTPNIRITDFNQLWSKIANTEMASVINKLSDAWDVEDMKKFVEYIWKNDNKIDWFLAQIDIIKNEMFLISEDKDFVIWVDKAKKDFQALLDSMFKWEDKRAILAFMSQYKASDTTRWQRYLLEINQAIKYDAANIVWTQMALGDFKWIIAKIKSEWIKDISKSPIIDELMAYKKNQLNIETEKARIGEIDKQLKIKKSELDKSKFNPEDINTISKKIKDIDEEIKILSKDTKLSEIARLEEEKIKIQKKIDKKDISWWTNRWKEFDGKKYDTLEELIADKWETYVTKNIPLEQRADYEIWKALTSKSLIGKYEDIIDLQTKLDDLNYELDNIWNVSKNKDIIKKQSKKDWLLSKLEEEINKWVIHEKLIKDIEDLNKWLLPNLKVIENKLIPANANMDMITRVSNDVVIDTSIKQSKIDSFDLKMIKSVNVSVSVKKDIQTIQTNINKHIKEFNKSPRLWEDYYYRINELNQKILWELWVLNSKYSAWLQLTDITKDTASKYLYWTTEKPVLYSLYGNASWFELESENIIKNITEQFTTLEAKIIERADKMNIKKFNIHMLENWYSTIFHEWLPYKVTIEDGISKLIQETKWIDEIDSNADKLSNIDFNKLDLSQKQSLYAYLLTTKYWNKILWLSQSIQQFVVSKTDSKIISNFIDNYRLIKHEWYVLPKIVVSAFNEDFDKHFKILSYISENRDKKTLKLDAIINWTFNWYTNEKLNMIKDIYNQYIDIFNEPTSKNLLSNKTLQDDFQKIIDNGFDELDIYKSIREELNKYAPNVKVNWERVNDIVIPDAIQWEKFILTAQDIKVTRENKPKIEITRVMDSSAKEEEAAIKDTFKWCNT